MRRLCYASQSPQSCQVSLGAAMDLTSSGSCSCSHLVEMWGGPPPPSPAGSGGAPLCLYKEGKLERPLEDRPQFIWDSNGIIGKTGQVPGQESGQV